MKARQPLVLAIALLGGCSPPPKGPAAPPPAASVTPEQAAESARAVEAEEAQIVGALAAVDARLAARMRIVPSAADLGKAAMGALLHDDEGVAVVNGGTDSFSFDARARRIDEELARMAHPPPRVETAPATAHITRPRLEWDLLGRLLAAERARVEEERHLPRSASELVRGIVATWAPASLAEAKQRDAWLTRRLDEVRVSLAGAPLRPVEVIELEDALDPLERLADPLGYPDLQGSLTSLRVALGELRQAAPVHAEGWDALVRESQTHLGIAPEPKVLRAALEGVSSALRAEATAGLSALSEADGRAVREAAEGLLLQKGTCGEAAGSRIRSFAPPPERAPICAALVSLSHPKDEREALTALIALSDEVTLAIWAIDISGDDRDPDRASQSHRLLAAVPPEREARLLRVVATRPLLPLGVAFMAELVAARGPEERARRASEWLAFGDAPLDVVKKELRF